MALEDLKIAVGWSADHQFYENYGAAWSCGDNTYGQLGLGNTTPYTTPQQLSGYTWDKFAVGGVYTLAVKTDGTLWSCGRGDQLTLGYLLTGNQTTFAQVGSATDWASVCAAHTSGYAMKTTGEIYGWGSNAGGELGIGNTTSPHNTPQATGFIAAQMTAGNLWAAAIKSDGTLWAWGANNYGILGQGDYTNRSSPTQIGSGTTWAQIAAGRHHVAAVKTDGTLWTWGANFYGQLGLGDDTERTSPTQVGSGTAWVEVRCAYNTTYARKSDGTIWSWGMNDASQAVQGDLTEDWAPSQVGSATSWTKIWSDSSDLYAHTVAGIYVGGSNWSGALGIGNTTQQPNLVAQSVSFDTPSAPATISEVIAIPATVWTIDQQNNQLISDSSNAADTITGLTYTMYLEAIGLGDSLTGGASTTASLVDSAALTDVIRAAINQLVADTANGTDTFSLGAALTLVDIADAVATQTSTYNSVMLVAELIATLEAYNGADSYDIVDAGTLTEAYINRLQAINEILEQRHIDGFDTLEVHVFQAETETANIADVGVHSGSLITALLSDGVVATIRLYVGGELFTGWVLNTDTLAPSEYQFTDLQFNSACKHGSKYLLAADDGIYEFTDDMGVETVMTYIKTGKTDFGSDLKKRIVNSYMVYSASGDMVLKVTTSEYGNLVTRNYRVVARADDTTDVRRVDIGRGIKSRYWQFELVGDGVDCDIDEIGMLPVVLSRRI